jgi:hypothetical protein
MTVALAELHAVSNTDHAEERVWRRVRGRDETWSVPGKLAITAWREYGIRSRIWQDDGRLQSFRTALPPEQVTFDVERHLEEHESALIEAEANGVIVTRGQHDAGILAALMDQGWRLLLVTVVPTVPQVNLHYLLGRRRRIGGGYALMDPAEDENRGYLLPELEKFLYGPADELGGRPRYLGITVGVLDSLAVLDEIAQQKEARPGGQ